MSVAAKHRPGWDRGNALLTPAYVLDPIRRALGGEIGLDPCTEPDNPTGARVFVSLPRDGMAIEWRGLGPVYLNPPYGQARIPWIRRALEVGQAGERLALLIPADTETVVVQAVLRGAESITFVAGRILFGGTRDNGMPWRATHPSLVAGWGLELEALRELGATLGG